MLQLIHHALLLFEVFQLSQQETLLATRMLTGIPGCAIGVLCSLFGVLAVSQGGLGPLLLGHHPGQLIEIGSLRLLSELSASGTEACESGELLFGLLASLAGALLGSDHPLPCALS